MPTSFKLNWLRIIYPAKKNDKEDCRSKSEATYTSLDIQVGVDSSAAAEVYLVAMNNWSALASLDIDTCCVTRNNLVVSNHDLVLWPRLNHDASAFEVLELALFDVHFCVDCDKTRCGGIIGRVAFQFAVDHLDGGTVEHGDARNFAIGFSEYSTIQGSVILVDTSLEVQVFEMKMICATYSSERMQLCSFKVPDFSRMMQYCFFLGSIGGAFAPCSPVMNCCLKRCVKNSRMHFSLPWFSKFMSAIKLYGSASRFGPLRSMRRL